MSVDNTPITATVRPVKSSADDLRPQDTVGEYRIIAKIAEGGMGAVYAATHPVIGKRAAVKVLHRSLCENDAVVARFVDEARAVNRIGHANIVDVFAFGMLRDGRSYLVMEWLDGRTLYEHIHGGELSTEEKIEILDQLAGALLAAHAKGIVHRDIKPENVFLVRDRERVFVKLLDFGVAKLGRVSIQEPEEEVARLLSSSSSGEVLGTPAYISPEQAAAEEVDHRTDVYSLGVVAFELFSGKRPFSAETAVQMLAQHIHFAPPAARSIAPELPPALDSLLSAMLKKQPAERPDLMTVKEVLAELRLGLLVTRSGEAKDTRGEVGRRRARLVRRFSRISDLSSVLVSELSRGAAWVEASGSPPIPGTPILTRFEVQDLGARVDFGGIASRRFAATQKVLIKYDSVPKEKLDRIFSVLAGAKPVATRERADAKAELEAVWFEPERLRELPPAAKGLSRATPVDGMQAGAVANERRAEADDADDADDAVRAVGEAEAEQAEETAPKAPRRATLFGLGTKVLALTVLVTVGAVISVAGIAIQRAKTDRSFYVRDLGVRTSELLSNMLSARLDSWRNRLVLAAIGGNAGRFELGELTTLTLCEPGAEKCETVAGAAPSKRAIDRAKKEATEKDLVLFPEGDRLLIAAKAKTTAIATLPRSALLDLRRVPEDLSVFVVAEPKEALLVRSGPGVSSAILDHDIVFDSGSHPRSRAGAREYVAADGTPMIGAWTKDRGLSVIAAAPSRVSADATRVLAQQVSIVALVVLGLAMAVSLVFARTMTRRLRELTRHATRVAAGDFFAPAGVRGNDEVGQLAGSFQSMTEALKQRDEDVLRIRQKMSEDESEALRSQMSEWLETDLASMLSDIQELARRPVSASDPLKDLDQRRAALEALSGQAAASLQHALAFAQIASRKVDLTSTVADAIAYTRATLHGSKLTVELEAANAVLFPRIEARESEIREMVQTLLLRGARASPPGTRISVALSLRQDTASRQGQDVRWAGQKKGALELVIAFPAAAKDAALSALESVRPIVAGHRAKAGVEETPSGVAIAIAFLIEPEEART